ncbi:MAG TPA: terminase small subunit [Bacteroidia bacterium]|nr:terminase small subunit [Bacteroidia bacterium]
MPKTISEELTTQQKSFADHYIMHGDKMAAFKKFYETDNENTINSNSTRLLKNAKIKEYIKQQRQKIDEIATNKVLQELAEREAANLLSVIEKRSILAKIARGEQVIPDFISGKYGAEEVLRVPTANERIKAIDTDNKMTGDNMPTKVALTDTQGRDVPLLEKMIMEANGVKLNEG